jgi:hypothetical protein
MTSASPILCNRPQRFAFLLIALVFSVSALSAGATSAIYISQSTTGSNAGTSCTSAHSAAWFNSSANWGGNSGQIGGGTTVHLCGTFTGTAGANILTVQGSGSSGNPIILFWEPGALVTTQACGIGSNACINMNGNSWITVDGNQTNPSVITTSNGSGLTYAQDANVFYGAPCNNCEFKNLTVNGTYVHTSTSDTSCGCGEVFSIYGSGYSVHDNSLDEMYIGVDDSYQNGDNNIQVYNNTFDHFNWGVHIGNNSTATLTNVYLHNNHLKNMDNWDTTTDSFHHDGLFVVQNNTSASITNVFLYDNLADGDIGSCCTTAWIFYNTGMNGIYVFNNVLLNPTGHSGGNAFMLEGGYSGDKNFYFYGNFIDCNGVAGLNYSNVSGWVFEDNAMQNCPQYFYLTNISTKTSDYNVYLNYNSGESHSINSTNLQVNSDGVPQAGSPLIHDSGSHFVNLSSGCSGGLAALCSDYSGTARAVGSTNWDSGAYVYGTTVTLNPPTGLSAAVN